MQARRFVKKHLPLVLLALFLLVLMLLYLFRPQASRQFTPPVSRISVEVQPLQQRDIVADIRSYGLVEPLIRSKIVAQVSGRVIFVAEEFRDGGFFNSGDVLLRIEPDDYEIEVEIAQANLAEAERQLQEEIAQAEQARQDWQRLGRDEPASPLVLREPQLESARAGVRSAAARLRAARLDLQRCEIRAPFDGRVLSNSIDLGQVVSSNTAVAEIYATDAVEVRLPIKNRELPLLNLPEAYQGDTGPAAELPDVQIISDLAQQEIWQGKIVRTASSIDSNSRQLYVVARIDNPYGDKAKGRFPLKIGQYVTARIEGRKIEDVLSVPNRAIYQGTYVYLYREGAVYRREIKLTWQNEVYAIVGEGLSDGDILVLTPLGQISSGTPVKLSNPEALASADGEVSASALANSERSDP